MTGGGGARCIRVRKGGIGGGGGWLGRRRGSAHLQINSSGDRVRPMASGERSFFSLQAGVRLH
jgi:hypothetical protein